MLEMKVLVFDSGTKATASFIIDAYDDYGKCNSKVSNLDVFKLLSYKRDYACGGFEHHS